MSNRRTKDRGAWVALGVASVALIAAIVVVSRGPTPRRNSMSDASVTEESESHKTPLKDGYVRIGGVNRPLADVRPKSGKADHKDELPLGSYGETPLVAADANRHVKSFAEAVVSGKHPERLSAIVRPIPFDANAYAENPQDYLDVPEPGRVFAPAQPGPGVPRISHLRSGVIPVEQGTAVPLQVKAPPGAPVTFTSFDLGRFAETLLTTATVAADERGVATVQFEATPGTIGDVDILAASPMAAGQLRFQMKVSLPKPTPVSVSSAGDANAD